MLEILDRIVTEIVAAAIIGMSVHWLRAGRQQGYGPKFIKYENQAVRYQVRDLIEFINQSRYSPADLKAKRDWKADRRLERSSPARPRFRRTRAYVEAERIHDLLKAEKSTKGNS